MVANGGVVQVGALGEKGFSSMVRRNQSGEGQNLEGKERDIMERANPGRFSVEAGLQVKEEVLTRGTLPPLRQEERMQIETDKRCG